ncbi:uncharacterized protein LOC135155162 [Lytechinus pictus]|uniref:uncharacterized protein LOC135155162 n=1 Tax=Lytechinus pictus TaxID=7653 RepID=UPI0030B9C346
MAEQWTRQDEREFKELRRNFIAATQRRMRTVRQQQERETHSREARHALFNLQRDLEEDVVSSAEDLDEFSSMDIASSSGVVPPLNDAPTQSTINEIMRGEERENEITNQSSTPASQSSSIPDEVLLDAYAAMEDDSNVEASGDEQGGEPTTENDSIVEEEEEESARRPITTERLAELIERFYNIVGREERAAPRFAGRVFDYDVNVRPLTPLLDQTSPENVVSALLLSIIRNMTVQFEDHDLIGFVISSPSLSQDIGIPLTRYDQFSLDRLLTLLEQLIQSNEQVFLFEGGFSIRVIHIKTLQGGEIKKIPCHLTSSSTTNVDS